jgi:hypothetical protein
LRQQLWQACYHGRQMGLGLPTRLVKNAGKAGYTNRLVRRYPNSNCVRTMLRRCHPHTRPTSVHAQQESIGSLDFCLIVSCLIREEKTSAQYHF